MPIDPSIKENGYIENAFTGQGLPIKLIADICQGTKEEVERHLQDNLVSKHDYIHRANILGALKKAEQMVSEGKVTAEGSLQFVAIALNLEPKRQLTAAEQDYALALKPTSTGFDPEPE